MTDKKFSQYQWEHTENALTFFAMIVNKMIGYHRDSLHQVFLQQSCFATEKFDGTNVAKDDAGQIYSRRLLIDDASDTFIDTDLKKVKEANIKAFRNILVEVAGLDDAIVNKVVVYGEFICNDYYDYKQRSIIGSWKVFGAAVEVKSDVNETFEKLLEAGFAAAKKSSNKHHIQLYNNNKFVEVASAAKLDIPENKGKDKCVANVIEDNKDDMKKGVIEGIVFTINNNGYKVIKWKGAQEYQPVAVEKVLLANDLIQKEDIHIGLKTMFKCIHEVITDISENKLAIKMSKKAKQKTEKDQLAQKQGKKHLTNLDKEMIHHGILHSQKKFDSIQQYQSKGEIEEYTKYLVDEVKKHLAEEKSDFEQIDDKIVNFITYKVKDVIAMQMKEIEGHSCST